MFRFGNSSKKYLAEVEPIVKQLCEKALAESKYDFSIISGLRTAEEQHELYLSRRSELDGYTDKSNHQSGLAVDIYPYVKADGLLMNCWNYNDDKVKLIWLEIGRAMLRAGRLLNLNIEWGITYNINGEQDFPHFQINKG